jgi:hypothetical protein
MKRAEESISLAHELAELASVLESAEMLAELLETGSLPDDDAASRAPRMLAAVIEIALHRVRLLRKVVMQQADVALLAGRRNKRDRVAKGEVPDVLLGPRRRR